MFLLSPNGELRGEIETAGTPIIAVAVSPDGALVAAAGIRGSVAIIERGARTLARTLVGPGLPVWSAVFFPDNRTLLTGGTDRMIRRWNAATGDHIGQVAMGGTDDPLAAYADDPGAAVFRACVACHTLTPDEGNRAGPTLHGIFGRRIATVPGYNFSPALKDLDIVWTPGDGVEAVRDRADGVHARHQDAGAEDRLGRGPRRAGEVPGKGHEVARINSSAAVATTSGTSAGRLWPARGISRRSTGPVKRFSPSRHMLVTTPLASPCRTMVGTAIFGSAASWRSMPSNAGSPDALR